MLMPPLCTAGYGSATGHLLYFLGAFYLFFINTVFIALSTYLGVRLMGFHKHEFMSAWRERRAHRLLTAVVVVTMIPAAVMTVMIVRKSVFDHNVHRFLKNELTPSGTEVISNSVEGRTLCVVTVGREINAATQAEAQKRLQQYGLGEYKLSVIQGAQTDSLLQLNNQLSQMSTTREADRQQLMELSSQTAQYYRYKVNGFFPNKDQSSKELSLKNTKTMVLLSIFVKFCVQHLNISL